MLLALSLALLLELGASNVLRTAAPAPLLAWLASRGISEPTPIQAAVVGRALGGESLFIHVSAPFPPYH